MKTKKYIYSKFTFLLLGLTLITASSCERELSDDAVFATASTTAEIFTDNFVGLGTDFYFPYSDGFAKPDIFEVDNSVSYKGNTSLRIDVPNETDPAGSYAGAFFRIDGSGRDLSGYDALTFWVKSTGAPVIESFGFGQSEVTDFQTSLSNYQLSTAWTKVIIPMPDATRLLQERGMFWLVATPNDGAGYSFWIDELKFEKLGTITNKRPYIQNGEDVTGIAFVGENLSINGVGVTFSMPNGIDTNITASPSYFNFFSSDASVAAASGNQVNLIGGGSATVTAELDGIDAVGSLVVSSTDLAPTPTVSAANVISIFSDTYTNEPVDYFNGYWAPFQTTQGQDDIDINGNNIIKYTQLNFVGTEFQGAKTIDASSMTHFHIDVLIESTLEPGDFLTIRLQDLGSDNVFGGGDDRAGEIRLTSTSATPLVNGSWVSLDIPFTSIRSLSTRSNLAQLVYVTDGTISSMFVDNIYFYN